MLRQFQADSTGPQPYTDLYPSPPVSPPTRLAVTLCFQWVLLVVHVTYASANLSIPSAPDATSLTLAPEVALWQRLGLTCKKPSLISHVSTCSGGNTVIGPGSDACLYVWSWFFFSLLHLAHD